MAVNQEYVTALVSIGKDPAGLTWLQNRKTDLLTYISLNQGKDLTVVSMPGQHLGFSRNDSIQDELTAIELALTQIAATPIILRNVYPVFW
jgi:hypothetical protein